MNAGGNQFGQPIPGMNDQGQSQGGEYAEDIKFVKESGAAVLKTGWSYLSWGAKAAKKRADDAGITDKVQNARVSIR